jgi:hypothetical protein
MLLKQVSWSCHREKTNPFCVHVRLLSSPSNVGKLRLLVFADMASSTIISIVIKYFVLLANDLGLPVIWTSCQFPLPLPSCKLKLSQSKVKT